MTCAGVLRDGGRALEQVGPGPIREQFEHRLQQGKYLAAPAGTDTWSCARISPPRCAAGVLYCLKTDRSFGKVDAEFLVTAVFHREDSSCDFSLSLPRHSCTFCFLPFITVYSVGSFAIVPLQSSSDF